MNNKNDITEKLQQDTSKYWQCSECGMMNRQENETCYFRCTINGKLIIRPNQLTCDQLIIAHKRK